MPTAPIREVPGIEAPPVFNVQWLPPHKVVVHNNDRNTFDEVIGILQNEADALTTNVSQLRLGSVGHADALKPVASARWAIEATKDIQHRRLA